MLYDTNYHYYNDVSKPIIISDEFLFFNRKIDELFVSGIYKEFVYWKKYNESLIILKRLFFSTNLILEEKLLNEYATILIYEEDNIYYISFMNNERKKKRKYINSYPSYLYKTDYTSFHASPIFIDEFFFFNNNNGSTSSLIRNNNIYDIKQDLIMHHHIMELFPDLF